MSNLDNLHKTLETSVNERLVKYGKKLPLPHWKEERRNYYFYPRLCCMCLKTEKDYLHVGTSEKWAIHVGITLCDKLSSNGWFNNPEYIWNIYEGDNAHLLDVAGYLAKIGIDRL